jgi:hypothetical protein
MVEHALELYFLGQLPWVASTPRALLAFGNGLWHCYQWLVVRPSGVCGQALLPSQRWFREEGASWGSTVVLWPTGVAVAGVSSPGPMATTGLYSPG